MEEEEEKGKKRERETIPWGRGFSRAGPAFLSVLWVTAFRCIERLI
jgi:hypothetical protein